MPTFALTGQGRIIGVTTSGPEIPVALRTLTVENATELTGALTTASGNFPTNISIDSSDRSAPLRPGDHVVCLPGTYAGAFTTNRNGNATDPVVISGLSGTAGVVNFTGSITLGGTFNVIHRLQFTGNSRKINYNKADCRITRNLFLNIASDGMVNGGASTANQRMRFDRNEFRNITGSAIRNDIANSADIFGTVVELNYFNGHTIVQGGDQNESVCLMLTDMFNDSALVYDRNLFFQCMRLNTSGQHELITVKTRGTTVSRNTILECDPDSTGSHLSIREAQDCLIEGNWMENGAFIRTNGDNHTIRNNRSTGKVMALESGDAYIDSADQCTSGKTGKTRLVIRPSDGACVAAHCGTRFALAEDNQGTQIIIGDSTYDQPGDSKVRDITLRNNSVSRTLIPNAYVAGTITESGVGNNNTTAEKLLTTDVGIEAP